MGAHWRFTLSVYSNCTALNFFLPHEHLCCRQDKHSCRNSRSSRHSRAHRRQIPPTPLSTLLLVPSANGTACLRTFPRCHFQVPMLLLLCWQMHTLYLSVPTADRVVLPFGFSTHFVGDCCYRWLFHILRQDCTSTHRICPQNVREHAQKHDQH